MEEVWKGGKEKGKREVDGKGRVPRRKRKKTNHTG